MSDTEKQFINIHTGSKVEKVIAKDESFHFSQIMGENNLTVYFDLPNYVDFPLGSYVEFKGETYTLMQLPVLKKINEHHYEYTLIFDSSQALLENYKIKNTLEELKFPITATPAEHLELLVHNLNQRGSGWSVGNCITSNEKLISYNHNNCREALQMIAEAFNTEWEVVGKSINLHKVEYFKGQPLALSYGKGNGFDSGVGRENSDKKSFGVLYVQGGNRNIDFSKYGSRELLLPKNQTYNYEGFSYTSDAKGKSITKSGRNTNIREESLDLSHIYPMRKGTVSTVKEKSGVYYFTDTSIPKDLDYSKYLIGGQSITVRFESGMLSGREFDANYNHKDRQFQLIAKEEDGINMPNDTFRPEQGNEYAVFNMMLPDAYICDNASKTGASWEMMKEACKYFYENQDSKFNFTGTINGIWAKKNWVNVGGKLKVGSFVSFSDTKFQPQGILIRITAIKSFINNPHSPKIELSNNLKGSNIVSEVRKLKNEEVRYEQIATQSRDFTKRRWRDTQETIGQIEKSFKNFGKSINPATVSTMSAIVGDKSLQYRFVNNKQNPIEVNHNIFFDKKKKQLHSDAGIIQHLTLGIDGVKPNRPNSDFYFWDIPEFVSGSLDDADKSYYLYAKVEREGENGEFILSETPIALDSDSQYFHLLVGTLNSEYQEDRGFATMYGFTEILPGQMTLTKLSSSNGQNYIKLLDDHIEINASVEFSSNSPAFNQMSDSIQPKIDEAVSNIQVGGRNLLLNSKSFRANSAQGITVTQHDDYTEIVAEGGKGSWISLYDYFKDEEIKKGDNKEFTFSYDLKVVDGNLKALKVYSLGNPYMECKPITGEIEKGKWVRVYTTFTNDSPGFKFYLGAINLVGTYHVRNFQLSKGNKPTFDWTPAPEDLEKEIEDVNNALTTFKNVTFESFKDGIIDKAEKEAIKSHKELLANESADIVREYESIYNDDKLQGDAKSELLTAKNDYQSKYNTLITAIDNAIRDNKITSSERTAVESGFTNYRNALVALRNALNVALDAISDVRISNIKIGSRNLLLNSKSFRANSGRGITVTQHDDYTEIVAEEGNDNWISLYDYFKDEEIKKGDNKEFTFSYDLKVVDGNLKAPKVYSLGNPYMECKPITGEIEKGKWVRVYTTFTNDSPGFKFYLGARNIAGRYHVRNFQLSKGNKPTFDWTPAPEDLEKEIQNAKDSVETLDNYVNSALKDNILDVSEAKAIKKQAITQKERVLSTFSQLYQSQNFMKQDDARITNSKNSYLSAFDALLREIDKAISDSNTTANIESKFNVYKDKYAEFLSISIGIVNNKVFENLESINISNYKINNLQIGTRNLFKKSYVRDWSPEEFYDKELEGFTAKVKASNIIFTNNRGFGRIDFKKNQAYAFYFMIKGTPNGTKFTIHYTDGTSDESLTIYNTKFKEVKIASRPNKTIRSLSFTSSNNKIELSDITVVEGSILPSSYIPTDEDVRMGVRNYLLNSNKFPITVGKSTNIILTDVGDAVQFERNGNGSDDAIRLYDYFDKSQLEKLRGKDCYFAFDFKVVQGTLKAPNLKITSLVDKECKPVTGEIKKGKWIRVYTPFNYDGSSFNLELNVSKLWGTYQVKNFQVSKGSNPTFDWKPAQEDYEKAVQAVADKTDFLHKAVTDGPVVATGTLMVGNETGANAGITGVNEIGKSAQESVRFYAGSNFTDRKTAPFRVLENGELSASKAHISGEIEATSGTIGGFDITEYDIRSGGNDGTGVSLAPTNIIYRDGNDVFAGIGSNVMPVYFGAIGLQRLEYEGDAQDAVGLYIKVKPKGEDLLGKSVRRALYIIGNNYQVGSSAIFETEYMGEATPNIVRTKISRTHSYIFTSGGGNVYLPNKSDVLGETYIASNEPNVTFELNFIVAKNCGAVTIRGVSDGVLLDNDAIPWEGGNGYMKLREGETLKLRYCNGYYYVTSLMR